MSLTTGFMIAAKAVGSALAVSSQGIQIASFNGFLPCRRPLIHTWRCALRVGSSAP